MNELKLEELLRVRGIEAPRLTPDYIDSKIKKIEYSREHGSTHTTCTLTLENGCKVVGTNACISIETYDPEIGKSRSYEDARNKVWELEGYLLREKLFQEVNKT